MHPQTTSVVILAAWLCCLPVSAEQRQNAGESQEKSHYTQSVSFLASIFGFFQDSRKQVYRTLYQTRDGFDNLIYDARAEYYKKPENEVPFSGQPAGQNR